MNNLDAILEIAIGLVLTWLILSVATMEVQDIINNLFNKRAKFLEESILQMFRGEKGFLKEFYDHPAIQVLYKKNFLGQLKKPSYIPDAVFAEVAFEIFVNLGVEEDKLHEDDISIAKIISKVEDISQANPELGYFVRRLIPEFKGTETISKIKRTEANAIELKTNAATWFDTSMTRASYLYKEKAKTAAFIIGFGLALAFNIDTLHITQQLWREPTLRQSLVAQAQIADENTGPKSVGELEEYYEDLNLPVGWETATNPTNATDWLTKLLGLFISGLAAMQGAPFWFDALRNLLSMKGGSEKEKTSPAPAPVPAPAPQVSAPPKEENMKAVG